jgi:hypothetical protein
MTKTIETRTNSRGHKVRIQLRRGKFDVLYNSNGYAWTYKAKSVDEQTARFTFDLETM